VSCSLTSLQNLREIPACFGRGFQYEQSQDERESVYLVWKTERGSCSVRRQKSIYMRVCLRDLETLCADCMIGQYGTWHDMKVCSPAGALLTQHNQLPICCNPQRHTQCDPIRASHLSSKQVTRRRVPGMKVMSHPVFMSVISV